jgi:hypothetical protein
MGRRGCFASIKRKKNAKKVNFLQLFSRQREITETGRGGDAEQRRISGENPVFAPFPAERGLTPHCQHVKQTARHCERSEAIQMRVWIAGARCAPWR